MIKRLLGLDTRAERYAYTSDARLGYTAQARVAEHWVKTTCGYCSVGCGMAIGVRDGKAVSVDGDESHPVNGGKLCPKGLSEHHMIGADNRALYPQRKTDKGFERIGWDAALREMAARFRDVQVRHGSNAVGVISTGQLVTEEFYALGKLVQLGIGTRNYDGNTTLCMASAVAGYKRSFGSDGPPGAYEDLEVADVILLIGANVADNHPILCGHLERNKRKTLITVDPRITKTAMMADFHLPLRPRTDIALLNGIAHVLVRDGLVNQGYVGRHTTGYEALCEHLEAYAPETVAKITGLTVEQIVKTAHLYGRAKAATVAWTMGVNHSTQGAETVNAINNLALLTGHIGRPGASPFSITGQCNAMGTREAGFASSLPGYRKFECVQDREELAAIWEIPVERIPDGRGYAYPDIIEAAARGEIKALWIIATNPVVSFPDVNLLRRALANVEFLVVQDGFHATPTTELADLVLPAAVWGEKEGTYTNSERRVSKVNKAVEPPGEARTDFEIFLGLAGELGCDGELFAGWAGPGDAFEEWGRVSAGRLCDYSGMSYPLLEELGGVQWPCRSDVSFDRLPADPARFQRAPRRLYEDGMFQTEDGRARLLCIGWEPFPEQPDEGFPLVLNTGRTVEHWHTRTKTAKVGILHSLSPRAWLEMNPCDALALNMKPHDRVDIVSRRGRVRGVELRVTEIIAPGQVFMPFHFAETNVNLATQPAFDPISREPNYKQCAVRVERAGETQS